MPSPHTRDNQTHIVFRRGEVTPLIIRPVKWQLSAGSCPLVPAAWPRIPKLPSAAPLKAPEKRYNVTWLVDTPGPDEPYFS